MILSSFFIVILILFQQHCHTNSSIIDFPKGSNNIDYDNNDSNLLSDESNGILVVPLDNANESNDISIEPLSSVNIDYKNNAIILKFRRNFNGLEDNNIDKPKRIGIDNNFMRFGRSNNGIDLNKRQIESYSHQKPVNPNISNDRYERSSSRGSRGDSFLRLGRSNDNLMRFGRSNNDNLMRFGRSNDNLMRFGRSNNDNLMRFGRSENNLMRFGRTNNEHLMRFGRSDKNLMRFGRDDSLMRFGRSDNLMRFGRPDNLMRFGRSNNDNLMRFGRSNNDNLMRFGRQDNLMRFGRADNLMRFGRPDNLMRFGRTNNENLMRFGRSDKNFMRFGKLDQNFMRFGKRSQEPLKKTVSDKLTEDQINSNETTTEIDNLTAKNNPLNTIFKSDGLESNTPEEDFGNSSETEYIPEY